MTARAARVAAHPPQETPFPPGERLNADSDVLVRLAVLQPEASQSPDSRALPIWLQQLAEGTENISQKATLPKYGNQAEGTNSLSHVPRLFPSLASALLQTRKGPWGTMGGTHTDRALL